MIEDKRRIKGEETKQKIINASIDIIAHEGLQGLSATHIAARANISKSSVFHHFSSIEEIPDLIVSSLCTLMTEGIVSDESVHAFFETIGEHTFLLDGQPFIHYRVLQAFYYEALYSGRYKEKINGLKLEFMDYIVDSVEKMEGIRIPLSLAELIVVELDALALHFFLEEDREKYLNLWRLNAQVYIQHIKRMRP